MSTRCATFAARYSVIGLVLVCAVGRPAAALAKPHHTPSESAIIDCHDAILGATRTLTSDVERHLGRCVTHGIDCLTAARDPAACCAHAATRCRTEHDKILKGAGEFEALASPSRLARRFRHLSPPSHRG